MMKKKYILTIMFFAMAMASCKKTFLSQEVNPNAPSVASSANLLSGAEVVTASIVNGQGANYAYLGVWLGYTCPSGNYVPSSTLEQYSFTNTSFQVFSPLYLNLANYDALIKQASADPSQAGYVAIAKIMEVYVYEELVDNYGNIPYSQALNSKQYLFPAYDDASTIYDSLLGTLDSAIGIINGGAPAVGTADVIFDRAGITTAQAAAQMTNWKKFANTLKLRIAIRQSNLTAKKSALTTSLAKTAAEGYLDDNTFALCNPGYSSSDANGGQQSPFYLYYGYSAAGAEQGGHAYYRANTFFVNMLKATSDPRLSQIFAPIGGTVTGNVLGADATNGTNSTVSAIGPGLDISPSMNAVILSGSEACFLLSEGVLEGLVTTGTAQDYYQRGIAASFTALAVPSASAAATTYYNQALPNVSWTASSANYLQAIITQKYIALSGFGFFEAYNEWRRTGYPNLQAARSVKPGALGTTNAPTRIFYPSTEYQQNLNNVNAQGTIDPFSTKIFWAK